MSKLKPSSADHADSHRRLLFLTMLFMSLVFATKAGFYYFGDGMKTYLEIIGKGFLGLTILSMVITLYWKIRFIPRSERFHLLASSDSFANLTMYRAIKTSWILTMLLLIFFTSIIGKGNSTLPAEFYLNLVLFLMLAIFSLSFFILFFSTDEGEHEQVGL